MITHKKLCDLGAEYLKKTKQECSPLCKYVVVDLNRVCECPDIFGWGGFYGTQLIEVKISHSDFLADKKKWFRKDMIRGLGDKRYYLCPIGIIDEEDLPPKWGLLHYNGKKIIKVKEAEYQECSKSQEIDLICGVMRREGIKQQIFKYKNINKIKKNELN